ncbi:MAG: SDR family oxidoreductase [Ilumatobacteraceae bacterium]|nr:SDR family oxidoreductase [Ilumatobacteraceae bacterium]
MGKGLVMPASNTTTFNFTGTKVLVSGGSNGIGLEISSAFVSAGAVVTITGTKQSAAEYSHDLSQFTYVQCQMNDRQQIASLAGGISELDILVNNAGQVMPSGGNEYDPDVFEQALQINSAAAFRLTQLLHPLLCKSVLLGGASVINMASLASFFAVEFVPGYGAAKAAVVQMTKTLAVHYAKDNIRVNAVAPGLVESNMTAPMLSFDAMTRPHLDRTPLARVASPSEIAPAVLFLSSQSSQFITGHTLVVDGGFSVKG